MSTNQENELLRNNNILYYNNHIKYTPEVQKEVDYILECFYGTVTNDYKILATSNANNLYIFGDFNKHKPKKDYISASNSYFINRYVITPLSKNIDQLTHTYKNITAGEVPMNIYGIGVQFRRLFDDNIDFYKTINSEHEFQTLTESNKQGQAHRTGIYLTDVTVNDGVHRFKLLRCSTNLSGPTDNLRTTDRKILTAVNGKTMQFYKDRAVLNHVLAQNYHNSIGEDGKDKRAKIKEHSDKTKDMPRNALMAFCSFYDNFVSKDFTTLAEGVARSKEDMYDYYYKDASVLTRLRFRLKKGVRSTVLTKGFDVVLYPNSVFLMSLKTNRLYTHEIVPPNVPVDKIPTRMGYVVRCSNTNACYRDGKTYILENVDIELEEPTEEEVTRLKDIYYKENTTTDMVEYTGFKFSLNSGDYKKPIA